MSKKDENKVILKECVEKGGQAAAAKAISQFFGIDLTRYISFTDQSFVSFIDSFEPTAVDITEDLSEVDRKNDIYIKIDKGRRLLVGALMLDVFAYTNWKSGPTTAFIESAKVLCAFLSQNSAELKGVQSLILASADTNLSVLDFETRRDVVSYLFSMPDAAESVGIYGKYQLQNTQFTLSDTSVAKISALF